MTDKRKDDLFICRRTVGGGEYEGATCYYVYTPIEAYVSPPVPDELRHVIDRMRDTITWLNAAGLTVAAEDAETLIRASSTPSAEVEYWKDKCYTAESDAEIHAQCHDKVFDEKKALEAEVQALREALTFERDKIFYLMMRGAAGEYDIGLAKERMTKALKTHTGGK